MNSTTLPPLKPRNNKIYAGGGIGGGNNHHHSSTTNLNATIATSGIRNNNNNTIGVGGGRTSTSSNGIQVQQLYDSSTTMPIGSIAHKNYLYHTHHHHHNQNSQHAGATVSSSNHQQNFTINNLTTINHVNLQQQPQSIVKSPSVESLTSTKSNLKNSQLNGTTATITSNQV